MPNTQLKSDTKTHDQSFRSNARSPSHVRETQHWPKRVGVGRVASVNRGKSLSNSPNVRPPTVDLAVRRPTAIQQFFASFSLERSFTLLGFIVAVLIVSLFGADLACGWPFRRASLLFDTTSTICGALLVLLCWDVFAEQVKGISR